MPKPFTFRAKLWLYDGPAGWHFVTLPRSVGKKLSAGLIRIGFGAIPVVASLGGVEWKTSVFPDAKSGSYLLPVKAGVRAKADVAAGDTVSVTVELAPLVPRKAGRGVSRPTGPAGSAGHRND